MLFQFVFKLSSRCKLRLLLSGGCKHSTDRKTGRSKYCQLEEKNTPSCHHEMYKVIFYSKLQKLHIKLEHFINKLWWLKIVKLIKRDILFTYLNFQSNSWCQSRNQRGRSRLPERRNGLQQLSQQDQVHHQRIHSRKRTFDRHSRTGNKKDHILNYNLISIDFNTSDCFSFF